ncbi:MAG: T9SS type A sorting domain-containing protein [Rhodothermales bacterium]
MLKSILYVFSMGFCTLPVFGQGAFINEMSQGSDGRKEWVELVVRTDGVDLRGWELGDNNDGSFTPLVTFTSDAAWSSVAEGTIIVIYNGGDVDATLVSAGAPDTDFSDRVVLIPHDNTAYFTDAPGGWSSGAFTNTDSDDAAALRNASGTMIHDMAVTHPSATVGAPGSGKVKYFILDDPADLNSDANWTEATASSGTPGTINPGQTGTLLPVELVSFVAMLDGEAVYLRWATASETHNAGFEVERKRGDGNWESVAFVEGHGTTLEPQTYTCRVGGLEPGRHVFRLKQVDFDGTFDVSPEVEVAVGVPGAYHWSASYPNPFYSETAFSLGVARAQRVRVAVYNLLGQRVVLLHDGVLPAETARPFVFDAGDLPSGVYLIHVQGEHFAAGRPVTLLK